MSEWLAVDPYDLCEGLEKVPVQFEDKRLIETAKEFKYVRSNIPHKETPLDDFETQISGCSCHSICTEACPCIARFGPNYSISHKILPELLTVSSVKPIYECNSQCSCDKTCVNRLVQFGVGIKMEVFKSEAKGHGLRTLEGIPSFSFVCEYAGEVLSDKEAQKRIDCLTHDDMNYLFVLKEHYSSGTVNTCVDPKYVGNIGRYINHSCDPNLIMVPVRVDNNVPKLALFSRCDIPANRELCYDYSGQSDDRKSIKVEEGTRKPCFCLSSNCSGYLPFDPHILA
ncbi:histone-lysine N-methyltransferase SETMAR-like isoform X1 [Haliotis asinina]|uniref:histone-lysine N-methyltransferase SETMAR-like isoform X1 n=1 Tax=Haliotis asinina TaxID=109174 RepID=UPI003531A7EE